MIKRPSKVQMVLAERETEIEIERMEERKKIESQETPKIASKQKKTRTRLIDIFAVQCNICNRWRLIHKQDEYEEIRSKFNEEPFVCGRISGTSCDDPADINYDANNTWTIDKPGIPITPKGFSRSLVLRSNSSKVDAYYVTPKRNRLKTVKEVAAFLQENPEYKDILLEDFNFKVPKIMENTVPACDVESILGNDNGEKPTKKVKPSTLKAGTFGEKH